jgi:hypothetical protein
VDAGTKEQDARSNTKAMSRVPWHLFQDRKPHAHLVVGAIEVAADGHELAAALNLLKRLVRQQKPAADYAASMARDAGRPEIYFAFDDEADARKFAAALNAGPAGSYLGWASQRAFELGGAKLAEIEASLPAPQENPRQREADGRRGVRGLRRVPNSRYE